MGVRLHTMSTVTLLYTVCLIRILHNMQAIHIYAHVYASLNSRRPLKTDDDPCMSPALEYDY